MRKLILALLLAACPVLAQAACPPGVVVISQYVINCPAAATPLSSSDSLLVIQGNTSKNIPGSLFSFPELQAHVAATATSLDFTNLPTTYNTLFLDCNGIVTSANAFIEMRFGEGSTPTWETASYYYAASSINTIAGIPVSTATSTIAMMMGVDPELGGSAIPFNLQAWIRNIASATLNKVVNFQSSYINPSSNFEVASGVAGYVGDTNVVTGVRILPSTGTITSGQCSIYGLVP